LAEANRKIKDLIAKQAKHEQIADQYLERVVLPELEQRRRKLD
jgi:hypothetical protein